MIFDVLVDGETFFPVRKGPVFGVYGPAIGEECFPCVLRTDGTLDFGANSEIGDRFHQINLLHRRIANGEVVTYTDTNSEEETTYVIRC